MSVVVMSTVVVMPGTVVCPTCSHVLHALRHLVGNEAPLDRIPMKCLNLRCGEHGIRKLVPLQRVDVEVSDGEPD